MPDVAFLCTDIEGSTAQLRRAASAYWDDLLKHREILRESIARHAGRELGTEGDSMLAVFDRPVAALRAALEGQLSLNTAAGWAGSAPLVRMGIHRGEAQEVGGEYFGLAIHQASRICSAAHGGQILVSEGALFEEEHLTGVSYEPLGGYRLKDFDEPVEIWQITHPALRRDFPALRTPSVDLHNLPTFITSFIGREEDVARVRDLISAGRSVTLTGPGGAGKTRLAVEAAQATADHYPHGVWFLDLAEATEVDDAVTRLGALVGAAHQPETSLVEVVAETLEEKKLLLLFDNCEHLLPGISGVVQRLLERCSAVSVLATSREPLRLAAESLFVVPPLVVPEDEVFSGAEMLSAFPATRLFVERARQVAPDFILEAEEAAEVAAICRRLDGLPLAIELVAPLVRVLGLDSLGERLGGVWDEPPLAATRANPRHRTLESAVEWSYSALDTPQRQLYENLSVFHGGCSLTAMEVVCSSPELPAERVLHVLTQLVDKSLVAVVRTGSRARYEFLESIRVHAARRFSSSLRVQEVRRRHRDWYLKVVEELDLPSLSGDRTILDRLMRELPNIKAALEWSSDQGEAEEALRIASSLWAYFMIRGNPAEGAELLETALNTPGPRSQEVEAKAFAVVGSFRLDLGQPSEAFELLSRALPQARKSGIGGASFILSHLGLLRMTAGDTEGAREAFEEGLRLTLESGETDGSIILRTNIASVHRQIGDLVAARRWLEEALSEAEKAQSKMSVALCLSDLGEVVLDAGDLDEARRFFRDVLATCEEIDHKRGVAIATMFTAEIELREGNLERARTSAATALTHFYTMGMAPEMAANLLMLVLADGAPDDERAQRWFQAADSYLDRDADSGLVDPSLARHLERQNERIGRLRFRLASETLPSGGDGARAMLREVASEALAHLKEMRTG